MRAGFVAFVCACGGAAPPAPPPPLRVAPAPARPHMHYIVEAGELGDRDIEAKLEHHAYVARRGPAWTVLDGPTTDEQEGELPEAVDMPILGEDPHHVRVVSTYDEASVALWVPRESFATTIVAATELLDPSGQPGDGVHGIWLAPGTTILAPVGNAALREVAVRDHDLKIAGVVHENALGIVWRGAVPPRVPANTEGKAPYLETATEIRVAPRDDARMLAKIVEMPSARVVARAGRWVEIAVERGGMKLRGYVHSADLTTDRSGLLGHGYGTGSGYGFGSSGMMQVDVPAHACLYDRDGHSVIGVSLETKQRLGKRRAGDFQVVWIGTLYWGTVHAAVKWVDDKIELCTP